jgi:hypothetical protein
MKFRLRAFSFHVFASFSLIAIVLAVLYFGWYRWPAWYMTGAEAIVGLIIFVDLGMGPLATLVVSGPNKPRSEWRRDIVVIVALQLFALGYGVHTLWAGRPLFHALSEDRVYLVLAIDLKDETVDKAKHEGARIVPEWYSPLRWVWAPLPDDPDERVQLAASAFTGGEGVMEMPNFYRPLSESKAVLEKVLIPIDRLKDAKDFSEQDYQSRLSDLHRPVDDVGVLPAAGSLRDGAWVFDRHTGEPLAFWPVPMWSLITPPAPAKP